MPTYYDEEDVKKPRRACDGLRIDLRECVKESPCHKNGTPMKTCLRNKDVPEECSALWTAFFECKRSILDNRNRFRGLKGY